MGFGVFFYHEELEGKNMKIMAKIQTLQALKNLNEILEEADGLIISRGSLGCFFRMQDVIYV